MVDRLLTKGIHITPGRIAFLMGGVIMAAFFGVLAGHFIARKSTRPRVFEASILLKVGQAFPEWDFVNLEREKSRVPQLLQNRKSILIFLTTDCPHCDHLISELDSTYKKFASGYRLLGVSFEPLDKLKDYRHIRDLSIPLYNDKNGKFTEKFKIDAFPTVIGVDNKGKIAFVEVGRRSDKTFRDYIEQF